MREICPGKEGHTPPPHPSPSPSQPPQPSQLERAFYEKIADPFARANGSRDARVNPAVRARVFK